MSNDAAEDYFVDGLTEDIITALAYWRWFPVVARNSTFAYKGKHRNVTESAANSAQPISSKAALAAQAGAFTSAVQLIEAASGHHMFAERYDRDLVDVFLLQEEIAERIVAGVEPEFTGRRRGALRENHPLI